MRLKILAPIVLLLLPLALQAARPLFNDGELSQLARLKTRNYTIAAAIAQWRAQDKEFFKTVLRSTSHEDLAALKAELPHVRQQMQKYDEALWLKNILHEMSQ